MGDTVHTEDTRIVLLTGRYNYFFGKKDMQCLEQELEGSEHKEIWRFSRGGGG